MTETRLQIINQFIEDVVKEADDLSDFYVDLSDQDNDNITSNSNVLLGGIGFFATVLISGSFISSAENNIGFFLFLILGSSAFSVYLRRNRELRRRNNAYGEMLSILSQKKSVFLKIRKLMNFYQHNRVEMFIKKEDRFTEKIYRNSLLALHNLDLSYDYFDFEYKKKLFIFQDGEIKKVIFKKYLERYENMLETYRSLDDTLTKALPFFIRDEIRNIMNDNRKFIPINYLEPCAKLKQHDFYVSMNDFINFRFGGLRKFYKTLGYQEGNLFTNTLFRKKFLLDQNFNVLKIK